jgi:hypothetical protein
MEFKGNLPSAEPSLLDWKWVKEQIAADAPVPYDASDPDDGPYDPNDDAAVEAYFNKATVWAGWPNPVMIQKDGVPVIPSERAVSEAGEPRAKAS